MRKNATRDKPESCALSLLNTIGEPAISAAMGDRTAKPLIFLFFPLSILVEAVTDLYIFLLPSFLFLLSHVLHILDIGFVLLAVSESQFYLDLKALFL